MLKSILFVLAVASAAAAAPDTPTYTLIFSRHGIRPPGQSNAEIRKYADAPWPEWSVAPGLLTRHGRELMVHMGRYYRDRYGLQGSDPMYFASDDMERTHETAKALAEGLTGKPEDAVVLAAGWNDPGEKGRPAAAADTATVTAALRARVGGNPASLTHAYHTSLLELTRVLGGPAQWVDEPMRLEGTRWMGPLGVGSSLVENLVLEYAEGQPSVGWGRVTRGQIGHLYLLHTAYFGLNEGTLAVARRGSGHLAARIQASLAQAAAGRPVAGAFGTSHTRLAVIVGHDGNLTALAALFGLSWSVDDLPLSPTLPGGALVFELRHDTGGDRMQIRYIAQTLDDMRAGTTPDAAHPPAIAELGMRAVDLSELAGR